MGNNGTGCCRNCCDVINEWNPGTTRRSLLRVHYGPFTCETPIRTPTCVLARCVYGIQNIDEFKISYWMPSNRNPLLHPRAPRLSPTQQAISLSVLFVISGASVARYDGREPTTAGGPHPRLPWLLRLEASPYGPNTVRLKGDAHTPLFWLPVPQYLRLITN